jgi:cyclin-dependent kinase regulatory subunit CKS1
MPGTSYQAKSASRLRPYSDYFSAPSEQRALMKVRIDASQRSYIFSEDYTDDHFKYRHWVLPRDVAEFLPTHRLMSEDECAEVGIVQSPGWQHYMIHRNEPFVVLFRRALDPAVREQQNADAKAVEHRRHNAISARQRYLERLAPLPVGCE